jgi:hypothetical protein
MTHLNRERPHPADDDLLRHADGELDPDESARIVEHLEACWRCRGRMERLQESIRRFTEFVDGPLTRRLPAPPLGWSGFAPALHREVAREPVRSAVPGAIQRMLAMPAAAARALRSRRAFHSRPASASRRAFMPPRAFILRPASIVGVLLAVALIWLIVDVRAPRVAAAELLAASRTAEGAWASRPEVVVHRTLVVEERRVPENVLVRTRRVDVWQHGGRGLIVRRVYDEDDRIAGGEWIDRGDARTLYQPGVRPAPARLDARVVVGEPDQAWRLELSAATFGAVATVAETRVSRAGDRVTLRWDASTAATGVTRAELTLTGKDLRPVAQTLTIRTSGAMREFRFHEVAFAEVPARDVPAARFGPEPELLPIDRTPATVHTVRTPTAPPAHGATSMRAAALDALELDAWYRAHLLGLVFGSEVEIARTTDGGVWMQLHVDNAFRRAALVRRLESWVAQPSTRLSMDAEVGPDLLSEASFRADRDRVVADGEAPLWLELRAHLARDLPTGADAQVAVSAARESVKAVETELARYRAYSAAIRAFVTRWPAARVAHATPDEITHWATVVRGQALALGEVAERLRTSALRPLVTSASCAATEPIATIDDIDPAMTRLLRTADTLASRLDEALEPSRSSTSLSAPTPPPSRVSIWLPGALCEVESAARAFAGPWAFTR